METTQNTTSLFIDFLDVIGDFDTICGVVSFVTFVGLFVWLLLTFQKKINKITKNQVEFFIADGKYIPQIYIELSEAMEYLRYFIYGKNGRKELLDVTIPFLRVVMVKLYFKF